MGSSSNNGVPVFGITGWKNSGKTLLTTRLISHFSAEGLRVGAIKHAHHSFEIDHEGRDSYKMRQAGARQIAVVSHYRWAMITELHDDPEPDFETILAQFAGFDLVLVEGYKELAFPKIETRSSFQKTRQSLAKERSDIVAIASDCEDDRGELPLFAPDDIEAIAKFIRQQLALT
ncbi:MAG: molybdopterin-guanine dinucleotide biosynthesis protein B [Hyphomicrobiaceae bacterium]|nr:molybdopterin-guanine dinucleotide biosynthesis protein B [Hyphomicrobiaceae bacterium]